MVILGLSIVFAAGLASPAPEGSILALRALFARDVEVGSIHIDGVLDESEWALAPCADRFVQSGPEPGREAKMVSIAQVLVDDEAIYVGVHLFDGAPSEIRAPLGRRDDESTSDWVFIEIDSRRDRRSAFSFGVNPAGVQVDGVFLNDVDYDVTWNGVWEAAASIGDEGWSVEVRIPFSQLAFTEPHDGATAVWGFNVYRHNPRTGESSNWSPRMPELAGVVSNFNDLHLTVPEGVRRWEVSPYLLLGGERDASRASLLVPRAGADLRVGLTPSIALVATVLPDFGQVEADPTQLNLTAFELFQQERRPFFTEGIDALQLDTSLLFATRGSSFAEESPFYTRRLGRAPAGDLPEGAVVREAPLATTILGAARLFGRTEDGWRIGVLAAATDAESALLSTQDAPVPIEAAALSGVARVVKESAYGDAAIGIFAGALSRPDMEALLDQQLVRAAFAGGVDGRLRFGADEWEARAFVLATDLIGSEASIARTAEQTRHLFQRPDATRLRLEPGARHLTGFEAEAHIAKIGGNLRSSVAARVISPGFDVNELGFQRNSDWMLLALRWAYVFYPESDLINSWELGSENLGVGWSWGNELRAAVIDVHLRATTKNFWSATVSVAHELESLSIEHLRGGPGVLLPPRETGKLSIQSDSRAASTATLEVIGSIEPANASRTITVAPVLSLRLGDHVLASISPSFTDQYVGWQFIGATSSSWFVARDHQRTLSLAVRADIGFSSRLVLQLYAQPFATSAEYSRSAELADGRAADAAARFRAIDPSALPTHLPDGVQRSIIASAVLRWEYLPGSFFTGVLSHSGSDFSQNGASLSDNLSDAVTAPGSTVLLLKADYLWSP